MLHQPPGGIDYVGLRFLAQAWLDKLAYRRAALILAASDSLAEELRSSGIPRSQIRVVPPGRDVAPAAAVIDQDLRRGRRAAFLCVANWIERKGIHNLLDAFAMLPDEAGTLHLAGDDNADPRYASRMRERLSQPDLHHRVVVHGPLSIERVAGLYASADVFVLPSLKEPYGTVYGEAMAYGLPVVGWRAGNLPYLSENEREGLIVEPGDVKSLAEAMKRLAYDEALRKKLGEAARQRALARPTWDETAVLFFGAIRDVVG
jgi:glycosyltransferase involved in cell wall biosynthesis